MRPRALACLIPVIAAFVWAGSAAVAISGVTRIVSVGSSDTAGNGDSATTSPASQSYDGSAVAFSSTATNLAGSEPKPATVGVPAGTPAPSGPGQLPGAAIGPILPSAATRQIYVRYPYQGSTAVVSVGFGFAPANGPSDHPAISEDGRFIAFESDATNLMECATNATTSIFVRDLLLDITHLISIPTGTDPCLSPLANGPSRAPSISQDGQFVAFESDASNLVANDTNGTTDVFVKDVFGGSVVRVSEYCVPSICSPVQLDGASFEPSISGDARRVAFASVATNVTGGGSGFSNIYVRDVASPASIALASPTTSSLNDGDSYDPSLDFGGDVVAFASDDDSLIGGDTNGATDVFIRRFGVGETDRISEYAGGGQALDPSFAPKISADGLAVAFTSDVHDFAIGEGVANARTVYVTDLSYEPGPPGPPDLSHALAAVNDFGDPASDEAELPSISGDGHVVLFSSLSNNLAVGVSGSATQLYGHFKASTCPNLGREDRVISKPVHETVEPLLTPAPAAERAVHAVNCRLIAPRGL